MNKAAMMIVGGGVLVAVGLGLGLNARSDAREKSEVGEYTCAILDMPDEQCVEKADYLLPGIVGGGGALVLLAGLVSFGTATTGSRREDQATPSPQ
jgi:hypothetical protein